MRQLRQKGVYFEMWENGYFVYILSYVYCNIHLYKYKHTVWDRKRAANNTHTIQNTVHYSIKCPSSPAIPVIFIKCLWSEPRPTYFV